MKKYGFLALIFVLALLAGFLSGCESTADKVEALSGTWTLVAQDSRDQAVSLLENIEAYEEEIALADLESLYYVQTAVFTQDLAYSFGYDAEATRQCVYEFYDGYFAALYAGRTSLNASYDYSFDELSQEEFLQFYADLYGYATYEELLVSITDKAYNYDSLAEPWETGTYTIKGDDIMCTITGADYAESLGYQIEGNRLTLTFSNLVEVYTKSN